MTILKLSSKKCGSGTGITVAGYCPDTARVVERQVKDLNGKPVGVSN